MVMTMDNVIRTRQNEIMAEVFQIEQDIADWENNISEAKQRKEMRMMEYQLMEDMENRNIVSVTTTTTTVRISKASFEDCLIRISENIGRPMKMKEIIAQLEKFNYLWTTYGGAYQYIIKCGLIEKTGGHGFYNIIRNRK